MPTLKELDQALAFASLKHFLTQLWHNVEPKTFIDGWHLDAIVEHLEACYRKQIRKLIINIPPRHMKSLGTSVFFCPWVWLHNASARFLYASYAEPLALRDSRKTRLIVQSYQYQELLQTYQPDFVLVGDQNTKKRFDNNYNGYRLATSVGGVITGEGGDFIILDDPHNVAEGDSELKRISALQWMDESMSTRKEAPKDTVYIVIMQRIHENDMTGHLLAKETGWEHLCLPARYEQEERSHTSLGFTDPRIEEDEPLWENQWDDEALLETEAEMTPYAIASQLQQRPAPRGGGDIEVDKIKLVKEINQHHFTETIRYTDKAGTEDGGAFTAGVKMSKHRNGEFYIWNVSRGQWGAGRREPIIKQVAILDNEGADSDPLLKKTTQWVEQEPGSGGKESAENTQRELAREGITCKIDRVTGDKRTRAEPFATAVSAGIVNCLVADWTDAFLKELGMFPMAKYKDQTDATSGAFNKLTVSKKKVGIFGTPRSEMKVNKNKTTKRISRIRSKRFRSR